jgi:hypothetical protein
MGYARKSLVSLNDTPYYHVVARCVRRAWLWGVDEYARRDYSHRKTWVLGRLSVLSQAFAVDVCAYAVMSNHYHLVLYVDSARAEQWDLHEVVDRWQIIFGIPEIVRRWRSGEASEAENQEAQRIIERWRSRLYDLSWYMRCLNEHLARLANAEDDCTGRFWEGRYRSQALLDEAGLLTAMAYVDLNPVRAGIAKLPEESTFTSIYQRIQEREMASLATDASTYQTSKIALKWFSDETASACALPFRFTEYLALLDWTGRAVRADKSGVIASREPPILYRLNINADAWESTFTPKGNVFGRAIGKLNHLRLHAAVLGQCWIRGVHRAQTLYQR